MSNQVHLFEMHKGIPAAKGRVQPLRAIYITSKETFRLQLMWNAVGVVDWTLNHFCLWLCSMYVTAKTKKQTKSDLVMENK